MGIFITYLMIGGKNDLGRFEGFFVCRIYTMVFTDQKFQAHTGYQQTPGWHVYFLENLMGRNFICIRFIPDFVYGLIYHLFIFHVDRHGGDSANNFLPCLQA